MREGACGQRGRASLARHLDNSEISLIRCEKTRKRLCYVLTQPLVCGSFIQKQRKGDGLPPLQLYRAVGQVEGIGNGLVGDAAIDDVETTAEAFVIAACLLPAFVGKGKGVA